MEIMKNFFAFHILLLICLVFNHYFIIYIDFAHIAASNSKWWRRRHKL